MVSSQLLEPKETNLTMALYGYARVSTSDQDFVQQRTRSGSHYRTARQDAGGGVADLRPRAFAVDLPEATLVAGHCR
ncbi:hypothetical protein ALQ48_200074 [Pseudomonas coronafaciens pv. zizaniae]|nr:hypothetical protein ALQ48_200074 [Pseudomonas coronafaciens pv. zizaniae]